MPDVISLQPAEARMFVALDVHKLSIVAAICRRSVAGRRSIGSRRPRRRSVGLSQSSVARADWRFAMRRGPAGSHCGGCWVRSGSRAM